MTKFLRRNSILIILFTIVLLSSIDANGLQILGNNHYNITKTEGISQNITFTIQNQEPINFVNINFNSNPYVSMSSFDLLSGANSTITANVIATDSFSGAVKIKGFYTSNLGELNLQHNVTVDYTQGLSICDFSAVKGDSIKWTNNVSSNINLINADTSQIVTTIAPNSTYIELFSVPLSSKYYFTRFGIRFTNICTITVLDTQGLINDPQKDAQILLDIVFLNEPTNISVTILTNNYTIDAGTSKQDILSIRNTGNKTAKSVRLSGTWFTTFTSNTFDLSPGESKNIGYTIAPDITNTSQTNQTYVQNLIISGNFPQILHPFSIKIPYALIDANFFDNVTSLDELVKIYIEVVKSYCAENPNNVECGKLIQRIGGINDSSTDSGFNLELAKALIDFMDKIDAEMNIIKLQNSENNNTLTTIYLNGNATNAKVDSLEEKTASWGNTAQVLVYFSLLLVGSIAALFTINKIKHKKQKEQYDKYQ